MHKKYIFISLLTVSLLALILFYKPTTQSNTLKKIIPIEKNTSTVIGNSTKRETLIVKKHTDTLRLQEEASPTTGSLNYTHQEIDIYETLSIEEAQLTTEPRKNIPPIGAIRIKSNVMDDLRQNDTFNLNDIEGIDYTMTISKIQKNSDGSITTTGEYSDEGITYTTTITQTDKVSYMTISTPQGIYEIETKNDVGYIYRTDTMRRQMQNTRKNDVIVLPIPKSPTDE